ncbi:hypothetical protein LINPERPRIM_LOCUS36887 [Linum perenne]
MHKLDFVTERDYIICVTLVTQIVKDF